MNTQIVLAVMVAASALAPAARAGELFGVDITLPNRLLRIDRDTAASEVVGATNVPEWMNGLTYDPVGNVLYGLNPGTKSLYRIDRTTGRATVVGTPGRLGFGNANGLAYDPIARVLYGTDNFTNALFTIDTATGVGTRVADITGGFTEIEGLGYDPFTRTLFGLTQLQSRVVTIDTATGLATGLPVALPPGVWRGLDFDTERRVLYGTTEGLLTTLYRIDPTTGAATRVGDLPGTVAVQGLAYVPEPGGVTAALLAGAAALLRRRRVTVRPARA